MRLWAVAAILALSACASQAPAPPLAPSLLRDDAFRAQPVPSDLDIFAVSPAMRRYLEVDIAKQLRDQGHLRGLVAALESNRQLKLEYDSVGTRTAAEAFDARAGNCLSLTLMTAALARELGLTVSIRRVFSEDAWTRAGNTLFLGGHVNIVLAPSPADRVGRLDRVSGIIIDFTPQAEAWQQRSREIGEATVVAMFMNNRAAEAMAAGSLDEAYAWARGAVTRDPRFFEAFNTLGVIYTRHGNVADAERVFRHVLTLESENVSAIANLAGVLERQGRQKEALALREKLRGIEPHPPFYYFDLGVAALKRKEFAAARDLFRKELGRNASFHEALFGLAVSELALGEAASAREHLAAALEASTNRREHDLYAAKLEWLRSHRSN